MADPPSRNKNPRPPSTPPPWYLDLSTPAGPPARVYAYTRAPLTRVARLALWSGVRAQGPFYVPTTIGANVPAPGAASRPLFTVLSEN